MRISDWSSDVCSSDLRGLVKNSSGYDLRHLAIGSEGTLGVVVGATLKLTDPPPPTQVMLLALPSFEVLMQVFAELRARLRLEAFEFFTDRALHHVLAHGGQAPFADVHPYYVIAEFAMQGEADEVAMLAAFEHCTERGWVADRSEEPTSELQSLMRISYAVFCLK